MLQSLVAALFGNPLFSLAMLSACAMALFWRLPRLVPTTAVLCINWALGTAFTAQLFDPAHPWAQRPWTWYLAIDYLAGFCLLGLMKPNKAQAVIGLIYAMMMVRHVAYWKSGMGEWATYSYDWQLTWAATAQFLVVTGWGLHGIYSHRRGVGRGVSPDRAGVAASHRKGA